MGVYPPNVPKVGDWYGTPSPPSSVYTGSSRGYSVSARTGACNAAWRPRAVGPAAPATRTGPLVQLEPHRAVGSVDGALLAGPVGLAQRPLEHLAGRGDRQCVDDVHGPRQL